MLYPRRKARIYYNAAWRRYQNERKKNENKNSGGGQPTEKVDHSEFGLLFLICFVIFFVWYSLKASGG